jgi:alcohol dehydrogenase class IV
MMAREAIRLVAKYLPDVVADTNQVEGREALAWADVLAGLCIANAGVTLPHGIGMTIGGQCPKVMHGEALAVVYPEFTRFTYPYAIQPFAEMGRIFNPDLMGIPDEGAAAQACEELDSFLKKIGMWLNLEGLQVTMKDVVAIADNSLVLPDYKNNPRIANRDDIYKMLLNSYARS